MPPSENATANTPLAPSVEKAFYRKCIQLKRRLNEVEAANDEAKIRRVRLERAIMKMRLERAFLLDELQKRMEHNVDGSDGSGDDGMATPPPERPHRDKRRRTTQNTVQGDESTGAAPAMMANGEQQQEQQERQEQQEQQEQQQQQQQQQPPPSAHMRSRSRTNQHAMDDVQGDDGRADHSAPGANGVDVDTDMPDTRDHELRAATNDARASSGADAANTVNGKRRIHSPQANRLSSSAQEGGGSGPAEQDIL